MVSLRQLKQLKKSESIKIMTNFYHLIKEKRKSLKLTQEQLAGRLDVDKRTVHCWEAGKHGIPAEKFFRIIQMQKEETKNGY